MEHSSITTSAFTQEEINNMRQSILQGIRDDVQRRVKKGEEARRLEPKKPADIVGASNQKRPLKRLYHRNTN